MSQFEPTEKMKQVMDIAIRYEIPPVISTIMTTAGVTRRQWYRWVNKPGFLEWWSNGIRQHLNHSEWYFDKVAQYNAAKDFKYWKAMQDKYFSKSNHKKARMVLKFSKGKI